MQLEEMRVKVGRAFKAARYLRGLSADGVAAALEISQSRVYRIERGELEATFREITVLAELTRLPLSFFEKAGA